MMPQGDAMFGISHGYKYTSLWVSNGVYTRNSANNSFQIAYQYQPAVPEGNGSFVLFKLTSIVFLIQTQMMLEHHCGVTNQTILQVSCMIITDWYIGM
jgi:hypothetical protein